MAKAKGIFKFGATLDVKALNPLDTRQLVDTYEDLKKVDTWSVDGSKYTFVGMIVVTKDTGDVYTLVNDDVTKDSSWKKFASGSDTDTKVADLQSKIDNLNSSKVDKTTKINGHDLSKDVTIAQDDITGLTNNIADAKKAGTDAQTNLDTLKNNLKTINGQSIIGTAPGQDVTIDLSIYRVVDALPTENIDVTKIYLVKNLKQTDENDNNVYTEYMYVNKKWEVMGTFKSSVDLADYAKTADVDAKIKSLDGQLSKVAKSNNYNDLDNKPTIGDGTLTVNIEGQAASTFKANATGDTAITITKATDANYGLVKTGYKANGRNFDVKLDDTGSAYVNVPFADPNNGTLTMQVAGKDVQSFSANDANNKTFNVPTASDAAEGVIGLGFAQTGKQYPVELDTNHKAFVNVPWTDTAGVTTVVKDGTGNVISGGTVSADTRTLTLQSTKVVATASVIQTATAGSEVGTVTIDGTATKLYDGNQAISNDEIAYIIANGKVPTA